MRWLHWQNLNDDGGSAWRAGRAWLGRLRFEWSHTGHGWTDFACKWTSWSWSHCQFHWAFLGCSWFLSLGEHEFMGQRETGFYLFGDHFNVMLLRRDADWHGKASGWRRGWFLLDVLLGRAVHSEGERKKLNVFIPMPERNYPGTCELYVGTWKRSRWFARRIQLAEVLVEGGVPFPGKGENAWDCGEDATHSMSTPAKTASEAIGAFVASVLRSREKYGGSISWRPKVALDAESEMRSLLSSMVGSTPVTRLDAAERIVELWREWWSYAGRRDRSDRIFGVLELDPIVVARRRDLDKALDYGLQDLRQHIVQQVARRQQAMAEQAAVASR